MKYPARKTITTEITKEDNKKTGLEKSGFLGGVSGLEAALDEKILVGRGTFSFLSVCKKIFMGCGFGEPPPLSAMEAMSEAIVLTATSAGDEGTAGPGRGALLFAEDVFCSTGN